MAEKIKKGFFKVLPWSMAVLMILAVSAGIWQNFPTQIAEAAAINVATNTELTPGSQFTTFVGVPVYRLHVANSGDASDSITSLSPTPSGSVVDTTVTLHFFHDANNNGIVDQGDIDIGADAAFGADNTIQAFDITDVEVPAAGSASILITADIAAGVNAQTFNLSFAAGADILMTVEPTGVFPLLNDASLTVSNSPPAVTVDNGANDPAAKTAKASAANIAVKQLAISAAAGTPDSIVSLAPTPAGTEDDNVNITSVIFYIDSGTTPGQVDGTDVQLVTAPATYTADNTKTTFTFSSPVQIAAAATVNILVVYNFGAGVTNDNTLTTIIAAAGDVVAGSGTAVTQNSTISATITIDTVAPAVTSATTGDADNDGKIDKLTVVYDSAVNDANYDAVAVGAYVMLGTGSGTGGATLVYNFTEGGAVDSGATPALVWTAANAQDLADNNLNTAGAPANADDGAEPVVITVVRSVAGGLRNRITITYSETMTITTGNGASTATKGDVTLAGTVAGFGVFAVPGDVTVPTAKNTVGGTGTTILTITLADQAGGYMDSTSTTEPSGIFTPVVSAEAVDGAGLSVNTATAPVSTSTGWDLTPPTLVSVTVSDVDGNGKIDQAVLVLNEEMRDHNMTSVDGTLGGLAGTFDTSGNIFTLTSDASQPVNTALGAHSQFNYTGTATKIIDKRGNLLSGTAVPGEIADGDIDETDGAAPIIKTITYKDNNGDGRIDRMTLDYSETVTAASVLAADDLFFSNEGDFLFATFGDDLTNLITGSVDSTNVDLLLPGPIDTKDDSGLLMVSTQNAFSLTDGINTNSATGDQTQATYVDGAAPVIGYIFYKDFDGDGRVDRMTLQYSETVTAASVLAADDLIFSDVGELTGMAFGTDATNLIVAPTTSTDVDLGTPATVADTNDAIGFMVSTQDDFSLTDGTTANSTLGLVVSAFYIDNAAPAIKTITYKDIDTDGKIDRVTLEYTETVDGASVLRANDLIFGNVGSFTGAAFGTNATDLITGSVTSTDINLGTEATAVATNDASGLLAVSTQNAFSLADGYPNTNTATGNQSWVTYADGAAPVLVTSSPANAATGVELDANLVLTFSEAMTAGTVTTTTVGRSPSFTLGAASWNGAGTAVTYSAHDAWAGMQDYTITLAGTIASAAAGDANLAAGPVANPFTFTTVGGGGGGGGGAGLPASVSVMSPNGGEVWAGLSNKNITWSSTSSTITKVKLFYSLDRGVNFPYTVATNETNDGSYSWTVPNIPSGTVKVKVEGYDESGVFVASDISDADFTIIYTTPPPPETETPPSAENPAGLVAGDLLKSPMSTTVYYYGSDNKRHIFPNEKTYKSWYPDWSNVKSITAEELRAIPLGKNVIVRSGTVLVKIETDPKVYAVEPSGLLRWIPTETRIKILYGDDWAKKIIDVPLAFWGDYSFGADISTDTHPTGALVQYSGTTDIYYIQGAEKRKVTTAGFAANNFRSEYVFAIPATISYANGADISGAEVSFISIY